MKLAVIILLIPSLCFGKLSSPNNFDVRYSQIADVFNFVDNLSDWYPGITETEYSKEWKEKHLERKNDTKILEKYKLIRMKYYKKPSFTFFSDNILEDRISNIFYKAKDKQEAFKRLSMILEKNDLNTIKNTINHFEKRIVPIVNNNYYSNDIKSYYLALLNKPAIKKYIENLCIFYGTNPDDIQLTILIVWRPERMHDKGLLSDDTALIFYNPISKRNKESKNASILMHELVHYVSKLAPDDNKLKLAREFQNQFNSPLPENDQGFILEEPLAVILGQMIFYQIFYKENYDFYDNWYSDPWIRTLSLLAEPLVKKYLIENKRIDNSFIATYSRLSSDVLKSSKNFVTS